MIKKRHKFLTFVFSLLPGAGHMFMGFMKLGLSFMVLFFFVIFISAWLNFGLLTLVIPIIWFYAFFDCNNKAYAPDFEFSSFHDDFLFSQYNIKILCDSFSSKGALVLGIILICLGVYAFFGSFLNLFGSFITNETYDLISRTTRGLPQILVSFAIIAFGIWLIIGKRKKGGA